MGPLMIATAPFFLVSIGKKLVITVIYECLRFYFHHRHTSTACNEVSADGLSAVRTTPLTEMVL